MRREFSRASAELQQSCSRGRQAAAAQTLTEQAHLLHAPHIHGREKLATLIIERLEHRPTHRVAVVRRAGEPLRPRLFPRRVALPFVAPRAALLVRADREQMRVHVHDIARRRCDALTLHRRKPPYRQANRERPHRPPKRPPTPSSRPSSLLHASPATVSAKPAI